MLFVAFGDVFLQLNTWYLVSVRDTQQYVWNRYSLCLRKYQLYVESCKMNLTKVAFVCLFSFYSFLAHPWLLPCLVFSSQLSHRLLLVLFSRAVISFFPFLFFDSGPARSGPQAGGGGNTSGGPGFSIRGVKVAFPLRGTVVEGSEQAEGKSMLLCCQLYKPN